MPGITVIEAAKPRSLPKIATLGEETVDPKLKPAFASELRAEYFVFGEDQEKHADSYPRSGKRARIPIGGHRPPIVSEEKKSANCLRPGRKEVISRFRAPGPGYDAYK